VLTKEEFDKLQSLARLRLAGEETPLFLEQLRRILAYVDKLGELDLTGVAPLAHPGAPAAPLREDAEGEGLGREEALAGASDAADGLVRVPPVPRGRQP
jgi:aspartyl-tRNA(Asn)/glutamyl-tRNA(Gln) amidotransferase subunit C